MIAWLIAQVSALPPELATLLLAALPVTELRAAVPVALTVFGLPAWSVFFYSALGNALPAFLVLGGLPPLIAWAKRRSPGLDRVLTKYFLHLENKHRRKFERYSPLALAPFVAIPLPMTGVWTGAVLAVLFGLPKCSALLAVLLGMLLADVIVLLIAQGALGALRFLLG
jgi:uncharacterized membrane protein